MSRTPRAGVTLAFLLVACAASPETSVTGIVTDVEGGLDQVESFTILSDGERLTFEASSDGQYAFPLSHLREHLRNGEPVRVRWREEGGRLVATFLDDG